MTHRPKKSGESPNFVGKPKKGKGKRRPKAELDPNRTDKVARDLGVETAEEPDGTDDPTVHLEGLGRVFGCVGFIERRFPRMGRGARARRRIFGGVIEW